MRDVSRRNQPENIRLQSRVVPAGASQRKLAQQEAYELAVERVRRNIQMARIMYVGEAGDLGIAVVSAVSNAAEKQAMGFPEERARIDAIADVTGAAILRLIGE